MAIIAISGKLKHGKDTVGRIIQYLTWCKNTGNTMSYQEWDKGVPDPCPAGHHQTWQIKKFAGKLKEICSILTGIPVEHFESSVIKDSQLPECWVKYGIDGDHDFTPDDYGYVTTYEAAVELANTVGESPSHIQAYRMTVRDLLQQVGTNALRNVVHPDIWVNALFSEYKVLNPQEGGTYSDLDLPKWIITDCRFPGEVEYIERNSGIVIRVIRPQSVQEDSRTCLSCGSGFSLQLMDDNNGLSPCCKNHDHVMTPGPKEHVSETALDGHNFKYTILNDGTVEELVQKVKELLIKTNNL